MATLSHSQRLRVAELHPTATWDETSNPIEGKVQVLRLTLQPYAPGTQTHIATAIAGRGELTALPNGNLLVTRPGRPYSLPASIQRRIKRLGALKYDIEIRWSEKRKHPRIFCLSPQFTRQSRPKNPHLLNFIHHEHGVNALCVYPPHLKVYEPGQSEPERIILWTCIYLFCDAVQMATDRWIGPEESHAPEHLNKFLLSECSCGCGAIRLFCRERVPNYSLAGT